MKLDSLSTGFVTKNARMIYANIPVISDKYPEKTISAIAAWLDIEDSPSIYLEARRKDMYYDTYRYSLHKDFTLYTYVNLGLADLFPQNRYAFSDGQFVKHNLIAVMKIPKGYHFIWTKESEAVVKGDWINEKLSIAS